MSADMEWQSLGAADLDGPHLPAVGQRLRVRLHDGRLVEYLVGSVRPKAGEPGTWVIHLAPLEPMPEQYAYTRVGNGDDA